MRRLDRTIKLLCVLGAAVAAIAPAAGQLLGTVEDALQAQIDRQVEEQLADALEQQVADAVEDQVTGAVEEQVQSGVAQAVERQVESTVTTAVEQQIAADVAATVEQQVEDGIIESIRGAVEAGAADTLGRSVESGLIDAVTGSLVDTADRAGRAADDDSETGVADSGDDSADEGETGTRPFVPDIDAAGRAIERDIWIVLVPAEHAGRIDGWGFTIRERRELATLGRVLLTIAAPEDRDIAQAALDLALDAPGTEVDFNHVYQPGDDAAARADAPPAMGALRAAPGAGLVGRRVAVGIIDSAVAADHEALRSADIVQREFVPFEGARPLAHGTAVAAILVGDGPGVAGRLRGGRLHAASVFFTDGGGNAAATTASLVAALEWLLAERVPVVNMSLAGPANRVLEEALTAAAAAGVIVVAAVGNNGPAGAPLYPAAYDSTIGVTAVDAELRVYRYANRGPQVEFAAPGVHVLVARSGGGYGHETGTSMAAPYVAAVIAQTREALHAASAADVLAKLRGHAIDLGDSGVDEVFGYGLIVAPD